MSNYKQEDIYVDKFDEMLNGKDCTDNNLKKDILDNLDIANRMFDKYNDFIFRDNDLKAKAKELHIKLSSYSD